MAAKQSNMAIHAEKKRSFDVVVAVDGGRDGGDKTRKYVRASCKFGKCRALYFCSEGMRFFVVAVQDVVGFDQG